MRERKLGFGSALRAAYLVFFAPQGGLRTVWRLALAILAFFVWTNGITLLLRHAFSALFAAWGVTARTVPYAPGYARFLAVNDENIISVVSSAGVAFFSCLAAPAREKLRFRPRMLVVGTLIGCAVVFAAAGIFRALDSVRAPSAAPFFTWSPVTFLPVCLVAAAAEEFFARGYILRMTASRTNRYAGYAASAAAFVLMTGGYALGAVGTLNTILFALVCSAISEDRHSMLTLGVRFGWSYAVTCLIAFPGARGGNPLIPLYSVSEEWLTGGNGGLISGAYMTAVLAAALYVLLLHRKLPFATLFRKHK